MALATPDLSSFVLQAQASKAKIIGIAAGPPNNMNEIKTGSEFGVFKGGQQMAALLALITSQAVAATTQVGVNAAIRNAVQMKTDTDAALRPALKAEGYLTRDPRARERKKYGQPGARKRFQFSKR